ncbi:phosphopantetheine-binding protein [Nonomuraea sediminis]|uniref:phosphopantetheine-binding protein n=1 Tax=Nonomuraea sediminis TaxID=2835864 RepID=UPI001BDBBF17|nr:phosphopantetheine-binding protein [Nonomuraea sediminis]
MTANRLDEQYRLLLLRHLPGVTAEQLLMDARLPDLGLDSLSTIQVLLEIEDEFMISIPDELMTLDTFSTVGSLYSVIRELAD